jgi:hypothetical protein
MDPHSLQSGLKKENQCAAASAPSLVPWVGAATVLVHPKRAGLDAELAKVQSQLTIGFC